MWLSLICMKLNPPSAAGAAASAAPSSRERGTPPLTVQSTPVPAQTMHLSRPRRSGPAAGSRGVSERLPGLSMMVLRRGWSHSADQDAPGFIRAGG